jgi:hypothetical protein
MNLIFLPHRGVSVCFYVGLNIPLIWRIGWRGDGMTCLRGFTGDHHHEWLCRRLGVHKLDDRLYSTPVPQWSKNENRRIITNMFVHLPVEALLETTQNHNTPGARSLCDCFDFVFLDLT